METLLQISAGEMLCIDNGAGIRLAVCDGLGLLTQEDEWDDVVLKEGALFSLSRNGKTLVTSRNPISLRLALPSACKARIQIKSRARARPVVLRTLHTPERSSVLHATYACLRGLFGAFVKLRFYSLELASSPPRGALTWTNGATREEER